MAIVHDIFTDLYTVKIYSNLENGEENLLGEIMLKRTPGGYRINIPEEILLKSDLPVYRLEFNKGIIKGIENASLTVKAEGICKAFLIQQSMDFVM